MYFTIYLSPFTFNFHPFFHSLIHSYMHVKVSLAFQISREFLLNQIKHHHSQLAALCLLCYTNTQMTDSVLFIWISTFFFLVAADLQMRTKGLLLFLQRTPDKRGHCNTRGPCEPTSPTPHIPSTTVTPSLLHSFPCRFHLQVEIDRRTGAKPHVLSSTHTTHTHIYARHACTPTWTDRHMSLPPPCCPNRQ